MLSRRLFLTLVLLLATVTSTHPITAEQRADAYRAEIEKWRADRESSLRAPDGWLSVAGLFFLKEGRNTFGSDRSNDFVLPASAPPRAGWFDFRNGKVVAHINDGVTATIKGKPVREVELTRTTDLAREDALQIGPLALFVHLSGDRVAIRLRDAQNPILREFRGLKWFPVNPAYRVAARYTPFDAPKPVDVPNILGDKEEYLIAGALTFTLNRREVTIHPFNVPGKGGNQFFIVFRDATSGKGTYAAARFVYADFPTNGQTLVDFNRAYNPPCAFNPHTTCPLPLPQNRLSIPIEAGEKDNEQHGKK